MQTRPSESTNRRRSTRRPVRYLCEAVRERGFKPLGKVVLDLSSTGMLLRTDAKALTGEPVFVSFFEPTQARWYDLEATVARVLHGRRPKDQGRAVGLTFSSLTDEAREGLERALSARRPSLPTHRA